MQNKAYFTFLVLSLVLIAGCQKENDASRTSTENTTASPAALTDYPNIVYILADDMGYGDISALNPESKIPTPHMDRLAREGMTFTDAHSPSAVCTPTRYGVLTGRYAFRTRLQSGVLVGHSPSLIEPGRMTVASLLREAGYRTACIGKWHLGLDFKKKDPDQPLVEGDGWNLVNTSNVDYKARIDGGPADHGFDYSFILPSSLDIPPYFYIRNEHIVNPDIAPVEGSPDERSQGTFWRAGDASRDFDFYRVLPDFIQEATGFIDDHQTQQKKQPFFLYLALPAPHTPWVPLEAFRGGSDAGLYGDFVAQVDHSVGQVLEKLDEYDLAGETLFILTSDNGAYWWPENIESFDHRANHVFSGMKSDLWEGGHHVPYLARWPEKIAGGSKSDQLVCLTDLLATCADILDRELPYHAGEDSFSHLPALLGKSDYAGQRDQLVMQSFDGDYAIREGKWKLILTRGSGGWTYEGTEADPEIQLYDLEQDIREKENLWRSHPEMIDRLKTKLEMYRQERRSRY